MRFTKRLFVLPILFFAVAFALCSQVTIGLDEAPSEGSLLDLKNMKNDPVTNRNSTMGLLLPRVELVDVDLLRPMYESVAEATDPVNKKAHMGLLVYNVTYDTDKTLYPGLYVWDGERWVSPFGVQPPQTNTPTGSNCYIVAPGKSVDIPVKRIYDIWRTHFDLGNIELKGAVSTEVYWQDATNLIAGVSLSSGDQGESSTIRVETSVGEAEGNALVVIKIDGVIRWSWHIWVTNYNPNDVNGQKQNNNFTFMDRHLGASNTTPGDSGSFGLLYQWGRKDPFPSSASVLNSQEPSLVGNQIDRKQVTDLKNLINSIENPLTFYFQKVPPYDWYTTSPAFQNENLWSNQEGKKAAFDPCPEGWRVPVSGEGALSPWFGLLQPNFNAGTGADWGQAGFYPATGNRDNYSGNFNYVGTTGFVWSASPTPDDGSYDLVFNSWEIDSSRNSRRGEAYSVRCVKE